MAEGEKGVEEETTDATGGKGNRALKKRKGGRRVTNN